MLEIESQISYSSHGLDQSDCNFIQICVFDSRDTLFSIANVLPSAMDNKFGCINLLQHYNYATKMSCIHFTFIHVLWQVFRNDLF